MDTKTVIIFTKVPFPGTVKTRLTLNSCISNKEAANIAKAMLKDTISLVSKSHADKIELGYFPKKDLSKLEGIVEEIKNHQNIRQEISYHLQEGNNFDERFGSVVKASFESGSEIILVLGADLPYMSHEIIDSTFEKIAKNNDAKNCSIILGPALEGGIYLVGITSTFNPNWFTEYKLFRGGIEIEQFLNLCDEKNLKLTLLPPLFDIDIEQDLITLISHLNAFKKASEFKNFSFPKYTDECIQNLGLFIEIENGKTRKRKLAKK